MIVSNVPGPQQTLYIVGARLREMYSVGPLVAGIGLNFTAWSYDGRLAVAVLADRDAVPDPHELTAALAPALTRLVEAAERLGGTDLARR